MKHICKICGNEYEYDRTKGHSRDICNTCRQNYRKKLLKQRAVKYKGGKCQICGYDKCENALVFHHLDPKQKDFAIGQKYNLGWPQLKKELDKCILLCANCHAEEHAKGQHKLDDYEQWIVPLKERIRIAEEKAVKKAEEKESFCNHYNIDKTALKNVRPGARKVLRPTKEDFFKEYEEVGCNKSEMGRRYGVSSKAIEKWIKSYEKYGV